MHPIRFCDAWFSANTNPSVHGLICFFSELRAGRKRLQNKKVLSNLDGTELAGIDATYLAQNVSVSWHSLVDVVNISAW
jgi:hypothetical protein